MPFEFTCPFCHTRTKVDDKYLGQTGACVSCGKAITLPSKRLGVGSADAVKSGHPSNPRAAQTHTGQSEGKPKLISKMLQPLIAVGILFFLLSMTAIIVAYSLPYAKKAIVVANQRQDLNNMRKIVHALNNYADRYGTYPPPIVKDAAGKPLYSWRVLVLPFLGYEGQYKQFVLDQAYDSPVNIEAARVLPREFQSVQNSNQLLNNTGQVYSCNFALLIGAGTFFPSSGPLAREEIDSDTLLLIETIDDSQDWTIGGVLDVKYGARPGSRPNKDLGGINSDSFLAVSFDETTFIIPNSIPGAILDGMISPRGKEVIDVTPFVDSAIK